MFDDESSTGIAPADRGPCDNTRLVLVEAVVNIIVATSVAIWVYRRSKVALASDEFHANESISRFVLLPAYQMVLYVLVVATSIYSITSFIDGIADLNAGDWPRAVTTGIWTMVNSAFGEGVALMLLQQCIGMATMRKVAVKACIWGIIRGLFAGWATIQRGENRADDIDLALDFVKTIFYWSFWLCPARCIYRRPSMRFYARGQSLFQLLNILALLVVIIITHNSNDALCVTVSRKYLYAITFPFLIYYTLLTDGNYWRGLLDDPEQASKKSRLPHSVSSLSNTSSDVTPLGAPLLGISLSEQAAASIAEHLDDQFMAAPRLNYAFLSLGQPKHGTTGVGNLLAAGGTARVYAGTYKGQTLAIKLIYCLELTPEIVRNFGREANRLYALGANAHVVQLIGICVRPPSLAMALELCHYGSLTDVLERHYHPAVVNEPTPSKAPQHDISSNLHAAVIAASSSSLVVASLKNNRTLLLDRRTRLIIALHCARGIAAMHSQSPSLLHLDLKAQNFLVARRSDVIALSGVLPRLARRKDKLPRASVVERKNGVNIVSDEEILERTSFIVKIADLELSTHAHDPNIRIPDTYQWTAPELLTGSVDERRSRVSTASDCFALGTVIYEIETGRIPYSEYTDGRNLDNEQIMIDRIISSREALRPLPADNDRGIDESLVSLIRSLWSATPNDRPTAVMVVARLTELALTCPL